MNMYDNEFWEMLDKLFAKYDIEIENACDHVLACLDEEGSITKHTTETAEDNLI